MNNKGLHFVLFLSVLLISVGCQTKSSESEQASSTAEALSEFEILMQYLAENGDYVNSRNFPSMIKAATVFEELGPNLYIIDLRNAEAFARGHIKNARNIGFSELPEHFQKDIKPFQYDKIVLVCDHGQMSSYATSLLRLMGYGNVYSMRWGMDCWNGKIAKNNAWGDIVSDRYTDVLEVTINDKPRPGSFPVLATGNSTGEEILNARMSDLFRMGFKDVWARPDDIFKSPSDYFIINFDRRDKYESGHIPGAIRYKPNGTLGIPDEMQTIPPNRNVVIYCGTGQNSAFATAYLRLLGYQAHSLVYGNNGFMHDKMMAEKTNLSWQAFGSEYMHDFPYETGP